MKFGLGFISLLAIFGLPAFAAMAQTQPDRSIQVLATFDYPGTGNSTTALGINSYGDIAGHFFDSTGTERGFIRARNGSFTPPIVKPDDTGNYTVAEGINSSRTICGTFFNVADGVFHGFFLSGRTYTQFDFGGPFSTFLSGLNDAGDFVGSFGDGSVDQAFYDFSPDFIAVGFSVPGATTTDAFAINAAREIVGDYANADFVAHGFFRDSDGTVTFPVDFPGATLTFLLGINDSGLIVGRYYDSHGGVHGMLLQRSGRFVSFDYPGATQTALNGINNSGVISGRYTDSAGVRHGFIARVR